MIETYMVKNGKSNFKELYKPNLFRNLCLSTECTQMHLLECAILIGKVTMLSYIPCYCDIFDDSNQREQEYIAILLTENPKLKKTLENVICKAFLPKCIYFISVLLYIQLWIQ